MESPADHRLDQLAAAFGRVPGVTVRGPGHRLFGHAAVKVGGSIFALVDPEGGLVLKLPAARVEALVNAGVGQRFQNGAGRAMKEWLVVGAGLEAECMALAEEARRFVAGG